MGERRPLDAVESLRNTRRSMGDGTVQGRARIATPVRGDSLRRGFVGLGAAGVPEPGTGNPTLVGGESITVYGTEQTESGAIIWEGILPGSRKHAGFALEFPTADLETAISGAYYDLTEVNVTLASSDGATVRPYAVAPSGSVRALGPGYRGPTKWKRLRDHLFALGVLQRDAVRLVVSESIEGDATATLRLVERAASVGQLVLGGYHFQLNIGNEFVLRRRLDGQGAEHDQLVSVPFTTANNTWYWIRANTEGARLRGKVWAGAIGDEPSGWMIDYEDPTPYTSSEGYVGIGSPIPASTDTGGVRRVDVLRASIDGGAWEETDFSEYADGPLVNSADWTTMAAYLSGRWQVTTAAAGGTGGKMAAFGPEGTAGGHWAGWTAIGAGENVDLYGRVALNNNQASGIIIRANEHGVG